MSTEPFVFRTLSGSGIENRPVGLTRAVVAAWTSRDKGMLARRFAEVEAVGVTPPRTAPLFIRISIRRLTMADEIEVLGEETTGEVEVVLIRDARGLWVGVGSDHTDRRCERFDVGVSKQICDKPIARDLWAFDDVADHWDALLLRSWIVEEGESRLYQEGHVAELIAPREAMKGFTGREDMPEGTALFCGTLSTLSGIRPAKQFAFELFDPVRERRIAHSYRVIALPLPD